ncbi:MAG: hypothetical protein AAFO69_11275 [Bacteroidota bacterium]
MSQSSVVAFVIAISMAIVSPAYGQKVILEEHFPGGTEAFWEKFQANFEFPESTLKNRHYGTSLISLTINSDGLPIRSQIHSQIDPHISKAIAKALSKMENDWKSFPESTELHISIRFSYNSDYYNVLKVDKSLLKKEFAEFSYIQEIEEKVPFNYKKDYNKILKAARTAYKNAALREARGEYSRLIAINPYELDFYTRRIEIETVTGVSNFACNDVKVLQHILNYNGEVLLHGCK